MVNGKRFAFGKILEVFAAILKKCGILYRMMLNPKT
jgi:hypothetical protein